jgi:hypothetical protein
MLRLPLAPFLDVGQGESSSEVVHAGRARPARRHHIEIPLDLTSRDKDDARALNLPVRFRQSSFADTCLSPS